MTEHTSADIKQIIIDAFESVTLGDGIGLWESQAIDDYAMADERAEARRKDERDDWQTLTLDDLSYANSALSFVDEGGMRFLLPAFIIASLDESFGFDPLFHLTQVGYERFERLSANQRKAVLRYLEFLLQHEYYTREKPHIERAILDFWGVGVY